MADYNDKNYLLHMNGPDSDTGPGIENEDPRAVENPGQDLAENEGGLAAAMQSIPETLPILPVRVVVIFN